VCVEKEENKDLEEEEEESDEEEKIAALPPNASLLDNSINFDEVFENNMANVLKLDLKSTENRKILEEF